MPPATLSINTDKSGYGKGESAKVIFTISSQDYSGEAEVTELNSRISKKIRMGRGETRTAEMNVPATASLDFYSTSGNFKSVPLEISESSMFSRLEVPPKVELNAPFNVTILVSSKNPVQVRVEFEGQNEEKTVSPSAEFTFEKKLGASSILSATVTTSSSKNTLRRFVEVIAPLEIEVLPPNSIFNEPSLFTLNPKVSGASINSIQTSFPWGNYSGESFTLDPPVCGIHYYTVSINYTSSSGESGVKSVGNTINIDCNPLSRLIVKILKMLGIV